MFQLSGFYFTLETLNARTLKPEEEEARILKFRENTPQAQQEEVGAERQELGLRVWGLGPVYGGGHWV